MSNKIMISWTTVQDNELISDSDDDSTTADAKVAEKDRRAKELRNRLEGLREEKRKKKEERERQRLLEETRKKEEDRAAAKQRRTASKVAVAEARRRVEQEVVTATQAPAPVPAAVTLGAGTCLRCINQRCPQDCKARPGARKATACVPCQAARKKCSWNDAKEGSEEGSEEGGPTVGRRRRRAEAGSPKGAPKKKGRTASITDVSGASTLNEQFGDNEEEEVIIPNELMEVVENNMDRVKMLTEVLLRLVNEWAELKREGIDIRREELEEKKKLRVTQERLVALLTGVGRRKRRAEAVSPKAVVKKRVRMADVMTDVNRGSAEDNEEDDNEEEEGFFPWHLMDAVEAMRRPSDEMRSGARVETARYTLGARHVVALEQMAQAQTRLAEAQVLLPQSLRPVRPEFVEGSSRDGRTSSKLIV